MSHHFVQLSSENICSIDWLMNWQNTNRIIIITRCTKLKIGNIVFLEIFRFLKDLCWKFRRHLPLVILQRAVCKSICLWSTDEIFLSRQNRIFWRKSVTIPHFFLPQISHGLDRYWIQFLMKRWRRLIIRKIEEP